MKQTRRAFCIQSDIAAQLDDASPSIVCTCADVSKHIGFQHLGRQKHYHHLEFIFSFRKQKQVDNMKLPCKYLSKSCHDFNHAELWPPVFMLWQRRRQVLVWSKQIRFMHDEQLQSCYVKTSYAQFNSNEHSVPIISINFMHLSSTLDVVRPYTFNRHHQSARKHLSYCRTHTWCRSLIHSILIRNTSWEFSDTPDWHKQFQMQTMWWYIT